MIANGLTKALTSAKHDAFVKMTSLEDQRVYLDSVRQEEEKKESLQQCLAGLKASEVSGNKVNAT